MPPTLKELVRKRLLEDCINKSRQKSGDWLVLVLDKVATKIISSCCRMFDITSEGITLVESLEVNRQPLPAMDAIYFLSPTNDSIDQMCRDFDKDKKKPHYNNVHIYFTGHVPDSLVGRIKNSAIAARILSFAEVNIEFLVPEQQLAHFASPNPLVLFSQTNPLRNDEHDKCVNGIVSLLVTLGEVPMIRYSTTHAVAKTVADKVDEKMSRLAKDKPSFFNASAQSPTLLVLDRSHDVVAPLLHEFTYQAMVADLLNLEGDIYTYTADDQEKKVMLNEQDPLWPRLRHMHVSNCITDVLESFNDFVSQNKAVKLLKRNKGEVDSLKDMSAAIKDMPQYREMVEKYELHIELTTAVMQQFTDLKLEKVAELEQDLAEGKDQDGKEVKRQQLLTTLASLLSDPAIAKESKVRLLMLYIVTNGTTPEERGRLCQTAQLNHVDEQAVMKLYELGVALQKEQRAPKTRFGNLFSGKKKREDEPSFHLSRFKPKLATTLEQLIKDDLSLSEFPPTQPVKSNQPAAAAVAGESQRKRNTVVPTWQFRKNTDKQDEDATVGPRLIVFIVGGATFSEARCVYELAKQHKRDVIIVSNGMLKPFDFVGGLARLDDLQ